MKTNRQAARYSTLNYRQWTRSCKRRWYSTTTPVDYTPRRLGSDKRGERRAPNRQLAALAQYAMAGPLQTMHHWWTGDEQLVHCCSGTIRDGIRATPDHALLADRRRAARALLLWRNTRTRWHNSRWQCYCFGTIRDGIRATPDHAPLADMTRAACALLLSRNTRTRWQYYCFGTIRDGSAMALAQFAMAVLLLWHSTR